MIRALASIVVAGLVCGPLLTSPAHAQPQDQQAPLDEAKALDARVVDLYGAGKSAEAIALAERALALREAALPAGRPEIANSLESLARLYHAQGRFNEAEPLYKRALAIREAALPAGHPDIALNLDSLAGLYHDQGRLGEAETLFKRALAMLEKALPAGHPRIAEIVNNLAFLYQTQGRLNEAEPLYKQALAMREAALPAGHPGIAISLNNLAHLYHAQGRFSEAEPLLKRALAIREAALPAGHPGIGQSLNNLAGLYLAQGRFSEAEPLYKRALAIHEAALPGGHPDIANSLNSLASLYQAQGRLSEAEPLYKRALAISEAALPAGHPGIATGLNNLAGLYRAQGRLGEAEPLYKRGLAIREAALPAGHSDIAASLNNLGSLYHLQGRFSEAEPLYERALAIRETALPADHPDIAISLNNLAFLYYDQSRFSEAEPLYRQALAIWEAALPAGHPDTANSLNNLGSLYHVQGRLSEAEPLYKRVLAMRETALPGGHPYIAASLNNLAVLYFDQSQWAQAADYWRRSTAILAARSRRDAAVIGEAQTGKRRSDAEQSGWQFWELVKAGQRIAAESPDEDASLRREMFQIAQWSQASEAAASLAQMAARGATGDPTLAAIVRERQDLVAEWQALDVARNAAISQPPDRRDRPGEEANTARLAAIDARIGEIDRRFKADFPDYAELVSVTPLATEDVQAMLGPEEALIFLLVTPEATPTPEETFVWVVTKEKVTWFRSKLGTPGLSERVTALRCGLDHGDWEDAAKAKRCRELLGDKRLASRLPFNNKALAIAHELYQELLAPARELIAGKELIIVPTGPLTALPFHILLTRPPDMTIAALTEAHRQAAWLVRSHAITVLPAVASLKALRQTTPTRTPAPEPFFGIGDPVLGEATCPPQPSLSACPKGTEPTIIAGSDRGSGRYPASRLRGELAEAGELNKLPRLCDTAFELGCVAITLEADPKALLLEVAATETAVKALSSSDRLSRYRVVHFATHGLLAGQLTGGDGKLQGSQLQEAGLVLTPPSPGAETEQDDGLLTASEITALKLNADWVILSACNTAAGDRPGTEALSGLARAFFYAGTRALLVSHWPVASSAAVEVTTATLQRLQAADGSLSRSEALRRSMLDLLSSEPASPLAAATRIDKAHPSYWAPFVLVGEGGRE